MKAPMTHEPNHQADKLLKKREVAEILGVSTRHVERMVSSGLLSPVRILGAIRYRLSQVQSIIKGVTA